ncbi:centromere protein X isoform X2 [Phyllostomus hastatus]|uniref:centromere protein X isoform X2 n=1 Tax=Phyllostomus hastatus TaxID=9423 RepID=UPI001E67E177|nr:centromere protein X isoform X2 [Phyllostomus hastatus]
MEGTGACFRKNRCLRRLWPSGGYGAGLASHRVLSAPQELVSKLLHLHFKDDKTREAAIRSIRQAQAEDLPCVDVDQLEKVLPQLLLDF